MIKLLNINLPLPRSHTRRLTAEMKLAQPGQGFVTDKKTAFCFVAWARTNGYVGVMKKQADGTYLAGRVS